LVFDNGAEVTSTFVRPRRLRNVLALDDLEPLARSYLPAPIFAYTSGASETNWSLADNRAAFSELGFVMRALKNVSQRSAATTLFGREYSSAFGIAPIGMSALIAYRGDIAMAAAAAAANVPMILSGSSLIRLEDVYAVNPDIWFQAYLPGDPAKIEALVDRVATAGIKTLVLTVDTPIRPSRENNIRAGFTAPLRPSLALGWQGCVNARWTVETFFRTLVKHGVPHFENSFATRGAPIIARNVERDFSMRDHLDWYHFEAIRKQCNGNLVVIGIVSVEDELIARDKGADGVILSNHGGRQLDGTVSPLRVLENVCTKITDMTVMMDSGVRRGTDVLKAAALGAQFVFVGRPFIYAAALAGEKGVRHAINILATEIDSNMALIGVSRLSELSPDYLHRVK
jgi:L-lactate dehydrogenase (cytochrome)